MEGNRVYLAACPDYGQAEAKLREAVAALGGMERFVRPGERILLKANLLRAAPPESAICTHPAVAAAAAKLVAEAGGTAVITDSPGGALHKEAVLRGLYEKTGMAQAAAASGAELCYDASTRTVSLPAGRVLKQAEVIAPVAEADGVFDLPKLKTHVLMSMTGAVKNLFGVLPGLSKVGYHATHPSQEQFADVLLDLAEYVRPRLSIMDGVLAMEGDGPGASGTPRHAGVLLVSDSPLALDAAAAAFSQSVSTLASCCDMIFSRREDGICPSSSKSASTDRPRPSARPFRSPSVSPFALSRSIFSANSSFNALHIFSLSLYNSQLAVTIRSMASL